MKSSDQPRSLPRRIFQGIFNWRSARRIVFGLLALVTLVVIYLTVSAWWGKRQWEAYKAELQAKGVIFDTAKLVPPAVPDDKNFAMTPLLKPLYDGIHTMEDQERNHYAKELGERLRWPVPREKTDEAPAIGAQAADVKNWQEFLGNTDIVEALKPLSPVLDEISQASRRPYARFAIPYDLNFGAMLPGVSVLLNLAKIYEVRAIGALANGKPESAKEDAVTILRLAKSLAGEPIIISQLASIALTRMGLQVVWAGLAERRWSDQQLAELDRELQSMDYVASGWRAMQGERAASTILLESTSARREEMKMISKILAGSGKGGIVPWEYLPQGWIYQNLIGANRHFDAYVVPAYNLAQHRIDPAPLEELDHLMAGMRSTPSNALMLMMTPSFSTVTRQLAKAQTDVDEARIACALERYRMAKDALPETLAVLVPDYLDKVPTDILGGGPLKYERKSGDNYVLYSVGWNQTDDHGEISQTKEGGPDLAHGDWVWLYPVL